MYKGEDQVLGLLLKNKLTVTQIAKESGLNEDSVRRIVESLKEGGYVHIEHSESATGVPTKELDEYTNSRCFPEHSVFKKAQKGLLVSDLSPVEKSIGIRIAKMKGFISIEGGKLVPTKGEDEIKQDQERLLESVSLLKAGRPVVPELSEELFDRKLLQKRTIKTSLITYTGKKFDYSTQEFELNTPSKNASIGKNHPITKMTQKIQGIMSELGFEEMEGNIIESSFWNFDALFQPQDHPARELADTFYIEGEEALPTDRSLIERVKKAHEAGWKYKWDPKEASKRVLRTHTTCLSARALASIKDKKPRKYFAIGRVFRNEATDYKHLAEFHQVEGIIAWENAKFTDLLGVLKEFYKKLGFEKIRFRPSFFPYTEPSMEIEVFFEKRKQWLELGGAGIFRPEVSLPLAGIYPVLAWGLSLERPLMLSLELEDIRDFYRNDLQFLSSRLDI